jgi:hypothetical protein
VILRTRALRRWAVAYLAYGCCVLAERWAAGLWPL